MRLQSDTESSIDTRRGSIKGAEEEDRDVTGGWSWGDDEGGGEVGGEGGGEPAGSFEASSNNT